MREEAEFELALRLRSGVATLGEVYAFISGLYFRGKLAYAEAFGGSPADVPHALVIVPGIGLVPTEALFSLDQIRAVAQVPVDAANAAYCDPFRAAAMRLDRQAGPHCRYILLGSIATEKYTAPLLGIFGERLLFPEEFIGRGDMSRGGLMLRCARSAQELSYVPVHGGARRGRRPPKLEPRTTLKTAVRSKLEPLRKSSNRLT